MNYSHVEPFKAASSYCGLQLSRLVHAVLDSSCGIADVRIVLRLIETLHGIFAVMGLTSARVPGVDEGIRTMQARVEQSRTCWKSDIIFHSVTIVFQGMPIQVSRTVHAVVLPMF